MNEESIIRTEKRIDTKTAPVFEKAMKEALENGTGDIIVDMTDTAYISSMGLRVLLSAKKRLRNTGRALKVRNVSQMVMEVFDITGYSGFLDFEEM